jgi:hypothetical protein
MQTCRQHGTAQQSGTQYNEWYTSQQGVAVRHQQEEEQKQTQKTESTRAVKSDIRIRPKKACRPVGHIQFLQLEGEHVTDAGVING